MRLKILELLIRLKKIQEEQEILRRNAASEVLKILEKELEEILNEKEMLSESLSGGGVLSAQELNHLLNLRDYLLELQKIADKKIEGQKIELANLEETLLRTYKERKLYERLRERDLERLREESLKKIYRETDELALLRRFRGY